MSAGRYDGLALSRVWMIPCFSVPALRGQRRGAAMRSVFHRFSLVMLVLGMVSATTAWAQQTGTLAGNVRDAQGAVLPGVTVTASSPSLIGGGRISPTGPTGNYQLTGLPPGTYVVTYELAGFTPL